jgi:hypothetical protein
MARTHARIQTSIWTDPDFRALDSRPQRAYLLLVSQPQINNCGVLPYVPKRWAKLAADDTLETFEDAISELALERFVLVDDETEELLVRTFVRHDRIIAQPNLVKSARLQFLEIESLPIKATIYHEHPALWQSPWEPLPEPLSEVLSEPLREPLSVRTRVRSRAGTRTSPTPSPKGTTVVEGPLGEEVPAATPGARNEPPTPPQQAAKSAPTARGSKNGTTATNLEQNGAVAADALAAYNAAARWLRSGGATENDWRYRVEVDFGVTDDIELAGLADLQQQLAGQEQHA